MRTKTLLLTAALGVASIATSMAQAVYSVNVVGYVNQTMQPGNNAVANHLNTGNNGLNAVIPSAPFLAQVLTFVNNNFNVDVCDGAGGWFDNVTGDPSTTTIPPGKGFFYNNPDSSPSLVTFVGEVSTGNGLTVALTPGLKFIGSIVPQDISLTAANGFPQVFLMQYLQFNRATQSYDILVNDGATGWFDNITGDPADARPALGTGFFINNPDQTTTFNWVRNFNPNQ